MKNLPQAPLRTGYIKFAGGLDTDTPPIETIPGTLSGSQNIYQGVNGGYYTHPGYERYNGKAKPSVAVYATLEVTLATTAAVGDTINDGTAYAYVLEIVSGTTSKTLIVTKVTGTFTAGPLYKVAVEIGVCLGDAVDGGASTPQLNAYYISLAADAYRSDIAPPTGSGASLGGKHYNGVTYTFRNAADGLSAKLWKSSSSGWEEVNLGTEVAFTSGGTYEPAEEQTVTGATSSKTAVIERIIVTSGSWATGDAAGRLILSAQSGAFQAENLNVGTNLNVMSIAGDSTAITLDPSGSYQIIEANFTSNPATRRLYGCDGVNPGFEFDGEAFVQIRTGMTVDKPDHVHAHLNHLFFCFDGSVQNSDVGDPYGWTPYLGAAEIGVGDQIAGFVTQPGSDGQPVLAIFSRNSIHMLYGTSRDDWQLIPFKYDAGAIRGTMQLLGQTVFLDTRGITTLASSQSFGNFEFSSVSSRIKKWLQTKINTVSCSCVQRDKNLYCLFFSDGSALYCTLGVTSSGNVTITGMLPQLLPDAVKWIDSTEDTGGDEIIFFGDSLGMVYQMNVGTSFDGDAIGWSADFHYVNFKSPNTEKKWRRGTFEMSGEGYAEFNMGYRLEYDSSEVAQPNPSAQVVDLSPARYDESYFDAFYFDGKTLTPEAFELCGNATNISIQISGSGTYFSPLRFSSALILYSITYEKR